MKKTLLLALALCLVVSGAAYAGISGSAHDLSDDNLGTTQLCVFCHHPHGTGSDQLLWNMSDISSGTWTYYTSDTYTITTANTANMTTNPQGSIECMHCHDGIISTSALVSPPDNGTGLSAGLNFLNNLSAVAKDLDLSDDHPVDFVYADAKSYGLVSPPPSTYPLYNTRMQCATCHEVHNDSGNNQFTRGDMTGSAMCQDCHGK